MKYIMRLDGKHRLLAAGARAETGSGKGGSRCRAGESAQSPSMRLSSGCMVGLLKQTQNDFLQSGSDAGTGAGGE